MGRDTLLSRMGFNDPDEGSSTHDRIVLDLLDPDAFRGAAEAHLRRVHEAIYRNRRARGECDEKPEFRLEDWSISDPLSEVMIQAPGGRIFVDVQAEPVAHRVWGSLRRHLLWLEVKTSITSFGDTLRQLQVYKSCREAPLITLVVPERTIEMRQVEAFARHGFPVHEIPIPWPEFVCRRCGVVTSEPALRWQVCRDGRQQIRADCPDCHSYIMFAPQIEEAFRRAGPPPMAD